MCIRDSVEAFGEEQQRAAVAGIGQHAAEEGEEDDGNDAHQAEGAQAEGLRAQFDGAAEKLNREGLAAQQLVDVPVDGDELHLRADDGDKKAEPKDAEVARAQRRGEA